uniref:Uncharacterized protein n=1 Tax=Plectus sambesii TaxID=2011161 RepID=A0A914UMP7_9BILA
MLKHTVVLMVCLAPMLVPGHSHNVHRRNNNVLERAASESSHDNLASFIDQLAKKKGMVGCYWTVCCEGWSEGHCTRWYRCCVGSIIPDESEELTSTEEHYDGGSSDSEALPQLPHSSQVNEVLNQENRCWTSGRCTMCCSEDKELPADEEDPDTQESRTKLVSGNKLRIKSFSRRMKYLRSLTAIDTNNHSNDCFSQGHCILCCY